MIMLAELTAFLEGAADNLGRVDNARLDQVFHNAESLR